jgi:prepilin-type N-terminal cleavage/methylation domain-containing protein
VTGPMHAKRRGWTLVELLVVITIMSVLLATVAVMVQTIMRQQRSFGQGVTQQRTLGLLARQIRHDIHAAIRVESVAAEQTGGNQETQEDEEKKETTAIRCTWPDGRSVSYQLHSGQLLRVIRQSGQEEATRQPFPLPPGAEIRLVETDAGKPPLATIEISYFAGRTVPASHSTEQARRKLVIEALIGRDLRWQVTDGKL